MRLCSIVAMLCMALALQAVEQAVELADSTTRVSARHRRTQVVIPPQQSQQPQPVAGGETVKAVTLEGDTISVAAADTVALLSEVEVLRLNDSTAVAALGKKREFNPNPTTALWMSALCPGMGQVYNRRYWKLPIVVGAFVGLSYGTSWNNRMLQDYSRAYRDAMDSDPETRSYMNFYPPTVKESDLDMEWLKSALKNKKDYFRRYRDICILAMVGVYALTIIDAYVDASLAHFDISPDLTMSVAPTVVASEYAPRSKPSVGLQCSISF